MQNKDCKDFHIYIDDYLKHIKHLGLNLDGIQ